MAGVYGNIEIAVSNAARFSDSRTGDTLIYPDSTTQRICMGVQQGSNAAVVISSNTVRFEYPLVADGIEAPGFRLGLNPSHVYVPSSLSGNISPSISSSSNNVVVFTLSNTQTDIRFSSASGCNLTMITSNAQLQMNSNTTSNVPTYSWQGDSNTGVFLSSNSQIGFACAGSNVMNMNSWGVSVNGNISAQNICMTRNKIINGDMRIDQRNNGAVTTSNSSNVMQGYLLDRFAVDFAAGAGFLTMQQAFLTSNDASFAKGFRYTGQVGVSNAIAMLSNFTVRQTIEGFYIADLGWGRSNGSPATLSFWFKSTGGTGQYCTSTVITTSGASTYCYYTSPFSYTTNNTWQYVSSTIPVPPSNITFTTLSNAGAEIHITPLTSVVTNVRNTWVSGTPPVISLTPYITFPAYTSAGGTFPTINSDRFSFVGAVSTSNDAQFINFGSQTFSFGTVGFSLTCTFRFTGGTANSSERIVDFGTGIPNNNIILSRYGTTSNVLFAYFNGTGATRYDAISTTNFEQNVVYNVAAVYNASASATGVMYLYVNGVLEASATPAAKGTDRTITCYVGKSCPSWSDMSFTGDIYNMNVYNRVISTAEIAAANTTLSNLQNWITQSYTLPIISVTTRTTFPKWNFTGGASPTFNTDRVTFSPGAVTSSSASCQFMNFGSRLFNIGTVGFSATCTFRFINTLSSSERIFDFASSAGSDNIICYRTGSAATLTFLINSSSSTSGYVTSVSTFAQNTTYNIALVYNPSVGANGTLYFYVNGVLNASSAASSVPTDRTVAATYVGKSWWGTDGALNADIYSLNIHNRVISAAEIAAANISSANISTWESTAVGGNSISITGVQFEKGSLASPFEFRPYPYELMLCQRYYYKRFNESSNDRFGFWATDSNGTGGHSYYNLPFTMRSNCTGTLSAVGDFQYGTAATSYISLVDMSASTRAGVFGVTGTSTTAYTTFQINTLNKQLASTFMSFDAEFNETRVLDLLSSAGSSAATAVYSLKSLSSKYTGPVVRVRRSTDNVEQDFYSSMAGALVSTSNGSSYSNWLGTATGYVTTWYDQSGQCVNAVQTNTSYQPTLTTAGKIVFNGTSQYLDRAYSSAVNTANFSLCVTCTCYNADNQYQSPLTCRMGTPSLGGYLIYKVPTPTPNFQVWTGNTSAWNTLDTTVTTVANTNYKIYASFNGSTLSSVVNTVTASGNAGLNVNTFAPMRIGAGLSEYATPGYYWNGDITSVFYFNTVLSASDRNILISSAFIETPPPVVAQATLVTSGLVMRLDADSHTSGSTTWSDLSGNGNNFTLTNSLAFQTDGNGIKHMDFSSAYVATKNPGVSAYSAATFICFTMVNSSTSNWRTLLRHINTSVHQVLIQSGGNTLGVYNNAFYASSLNVSTIANLSTKFNMWVFRLAQTSPYLRVSVNNTTVLASMTDANTSFTQAIGYIGANGAGASPSQFWGKIAQVLYYNRTLTDDEITQTFDAFKTRYAL